MVKKKFITIIDDGTTTFEKKYCSYCGRPLYSIDKNICVYCEELKKEFENGK